MVSIIPVPSGHHWCLLSSFTLNLPLTPLDSFTPSSPWTHRGTQDYPSKKLSVDAHSLWQRGNGAVKSVLRCVSVRQCCRLMALGLAWQRRKGAVSLYLSWLCDLIVTYSTPLAFLIASATQGNISWYDQRARYNKVYCMCSCSRCFRSDFDGFNLGTWTLWPLGPALIHAVVARDLWVMGRELGES